MTTKHYKMLLNSYFDVAQDKFDISCVCSTAVNELMRGIRTQINSLITGLFTWYCFMVLELKNLIKVVHVIF